MNVATTYFALAVNLTLLIILAVLWRQLIVARFRSRLFEIRDSVFDLARQGQLDFRSPSYQLLREHCNDLIRNGHRFSISRFFLFMIFVRPHTNRIGDDDAWKRALSALPMDTRRILERKRLETIHEVVRLMARGFFVGTFLMIIRHMGLANRIIKACSSEVKRSVQIVKASEHFEDRAIRH